MFIHPFIYSFIHSFIYSASVTALVRVVVDPKPVQEPLGPLQENTLHGMPAQSKAPSISMHIPT